MADHRIGVRQEDLDQIAKEGGPAVTPLPLKQKVGAVFEPSKIHSVGSTATVREAFKLLIDNGVLSVPVFDNKTGRYTKFVDILDILTFVMKELGKDVMKTGYETVASNPVFAAQCKSVADSSRRNQFVSVDADATMETVAAAMVRSNAHRIAVVDRTGEMEGLISESTIIRWAAEACKDLEVCKKTVADLGLAPKDVLSVDINADAIVAFCKIVEQDVSGLAVVDDAGKLVANISASDLKRLGYSEYMFGNLFMPLAGFLVLSDSDIITPVHVKPSATFQEVLDVFADKKVHRVFVVDDDLKPVGVVSLGDALKVLIS